MQLQALDLPSPEPAGGSAYYREQRQIALDFDPRRAGNFAKYMRWKKYGGEVDYLPIKMDIENVSRCNFRCQMCVVSDWQKGKRAEDLPFDDFVQLLDDQYGLVEIKLQGIGEPLMMGQTYFDMLQFARSKKIWVRSTTNAALLHLSDNYQKIIDADINELQISIDGADRETFQKIRRGSVFEQVVANCKLINDYSKSRGVVRTKMWTIVQRDNIHQLNDFVPLASELGFTNQVFMINLLDWGLDSWHERNAEIGVADQLRPEQLLGLVEHGERLGVRVRFWSAIDKYSFTSRDTVCPWPFERSYISSDLRVVPCCMIGNPDVLEIDSLAQKGSFSHIWFGENYRKFREAHLSGDLPKVCRSCYFSD